MQLPGTGGNPVSVADSFFNVQQFFTPDLGRYYSEMQYTDTLSDPNLNIWRRALGFMKTRAEETGMPLPPPLQLPSDLSARAVEAARTVIFEPMQPQPVPPQQNIDRSWTITVANPSTSQTTLMSNQVGAPVPGAPLGTTTSTWSGAPFGMQLQGNQVAGPGFRESPIARGGESEMRYGGGVRYRIPKPEFFVEPLPGSTPAIVSEKSSSKKSSSSSRHGGSGAHKSKSKSKSKTAATHKSSKSKTKSKRSGGSSNSKSKSSKSKSKSSSSQKSKDLRKGGGCPCEDTL
jgi:hypothetical protein